jgi:anti-sigma factor RsiW
MSQISEEDRANLVAYLDGELEEEAAQAFEARLSCEPQLRAEADALQRTWDLLDYLPRPEPSASFTHRTLERLAIRDTGIALAPPARPWMWLTPIGWAAAMLIAMGGGLLAAHYLWPPQTPGPGPQQGPQQAEVEALIVRDVDFIRSKRLYDHADDLDFVRELEKALGEEDGGL